MSDHRRHQVINDRARRQDELQRESPGLPPGAVTWNDSTWGQPSSATRFR